MPPSPYVRTTLLIHPQARLDVVSGTITIRSPAHVDFAPSIRYSITGHSASPRQLLSLRVTGQSAASLPFDCRLSICDAPRQFIIRRRLVIENELDDELVSDGVAYIDEPRSLVFCSLDATNFDARTVPSTYVSRRHPHAHLLREVAMAQELESMHPLTRRCASRASLVSAPLEASDVFVFTRDALTRACKYITDELVPHTKRFFDAEHVSIAVVPLGASSPTTEEINITVTFEACMIKM
jgi:hypothetical protein